MNDEQTSSTSVGESPADPIAKAIEKLGHNISESDQNYEKSQHDKGSIAGMQHAYDLFTRAYTQTAAARSVATGGASADLEKLEAIIRRGPTLPLEAVYESDEDGTNAFLFAAGDAKRHSEGDYCELAIFTSQEEIDLVLAAVNALPALIAEIRAARLREGEALPVTYATVTQREQLNTLLAHPLIPAAEKTHALLGILRLTDTQADQLIAQLQATITA